MIPPANTSEFCGTAETIDSVFDFSTEHALAQWDLGNFSNLRMRQMSIRILSSRQIFNNNP